MYNTVIIVAAGKGSRMKAGVPKQYLKIGDKEILSHTIEKFEACGSINEIILAADEDCIDFCQLEIVSRYNYTKVKKIVRGGDQRQHSVSNALKAVNPSTDIVLIHDGVRPFIDNDRIETVIEAAKTHGCAVLGIKVKDTVKVCDNNDFVLDTPDRNFLWLAQTPQGFKYDIILSMYEKAIAEQYLGTDDAMLAANYGFKVKMIGGSYDNIKITTPEDMILGEAILRRNGYDPYQTVPIP